MHVGRKSDDGPKESDDGPKESVMCICAPLTAARQADHAAASEEEAAFLRVPIAIKDVTDAAGFRSAYSSRA